MVRFKDWTGNKRGKQLMSKEKHKKLKELLLEIIKKIYKQVWLLGSNI